MIPCKDNTARKRPEMIITEEEVKKILDQFPKTSMYRIAILLQYATGIRASEVVAIQLFDFSDDFKRLKVRLSKRKDNKIVIRCIPDSLAELIKLYVEANLHRFKDGFIFPAIGSGAKGSHITNGTYITTFQKARNKAGLTDWQLRDKRGRPMYRIGTHSLRRRYLSNIVNDKMVDVEEARKIIGHTKIDTTLRYLYENSQLRAIERVANNHNFKKLIKVEAVAKIYNK